MLVVEMVAGGIGEVYLDRTVLLGGARRLGIGGKGIEEKNRQNIGVIGVMRVEKLWKFVYFRIVLKNLQHF